MWKDLRVQMKQRPDLPVPHHERVAALEAIPAMLTKHVSQRAHR